MSVKIGSARIDENGNIKGGKAGDNNGREVSTQNWYLHKKGWRVFRAKCAYVAEKIAYDMQAACDNKNIGYNQSKRLTLYNVAKKVNFDCALVTTKCETDCSALIRVCCAYAGIPLSNFTTANESKILLDSGEFMELTDKIYTTSSDYLRRGDILVTKTQGHTVVVLSDGNKTHIVLDKVKVVAQSVFVRLCPDKTSPSLGIVHLNDEFDFIRETENWYCIKYKDYDGYITKKYSIRTN